jgi:hypothetical protein
MAGQIQITSEGKIKIRSDGKVQTLTPFDCEADIPFYRSNLAVTIDFSYPSQSYIDDNPEIPICQITGTASESITIACAPGTPGTCLLQWYPDTDPTIIGPCNYLDRPLPDAGPSIVTPVGGATEEDCDVACSDGNRENAYFSLEPEPYWDEGLSRWVCDWIFRFACCDDNSCPAQQNNFFVGTQAGTAKDIRSAGQFTYDDDSGGSGEVHFTAQWTFV